MPHDSAIFLDHEPYKRRLIASTIDSIARSSPDRTYASVPVSNADLSHGFRDISYTQFAAAIDRTAYWLDEHLPVSQSRSGSVASLSSSSTSDPRSDYSPAAGSIQTFAYYGPRDLRYVAFVCATMKTGRRILLTSLLGSLEAQVHLAKLADCRIFLYADGGPEVVPAHVRQIPKNVDDSVSITVPEFEDLFFGNERAQHRSYPYEKTWEEGRLDEVGIYHTSGSSGFPKLVVYTNEMLAQIDSWNVLDGVDGMTTCREYYENKRIWIGMPIFHLSGGCVALHCAVFFSTVPVLGPPTALPSPSLFAQMHAHARLDGIAVSPSLLEDFVRDRSLHGALRSLKMVAFGGAPLAKPAGDFLAPLGSLRTSIGSTEGGYWPTLRPSSAEDWEYIAPHPAMGASFEPSVEDGFYELVVRRTPRSEVFTNFFRAKMIGPGGRGGECDGETFRTKDLWSPHPDPEKMKLGAGLWKYRGRTDDLVVLTGEVKMYAGKVEETLKCHPLVKHALVGGYQRRVPFLLLEVFEGVRTETEQDREKVLDEVWSAVEKANEDLGVRGKLRRALALVAVQEKPFVRLGKGTVDRRGTFARYEKEVDEMYQKFQEEPRQGSSL